MVWLSLVAVHTGHVVLVGLTLLLGPVVEVGETVTVESPLYTTVEHMVVVDQSGPVLTEVEVLVELVSSSSHSLSDDDEEVVVDVTLVGATLWLPEGVEDGLDVEEEVSLVGQILSVMVVVTMGRLILFQSRE